MNIEFSRESDPMARHVVKVASISDDENKTALVFEGVRGVLLNAGGRGLQPYVH